LNDQPLLSGIVIKPNETHQLYMPNGWVILAEPESLLGEAISELPMQLPVAKPDARIDALIQQLNKFPKLISALKCNPYQCHDERLLKLLARLDTCLNGDCLKPEQWRAKEIAGWLAISESRFLHLVKAELGIAWRPYLLWRRLICAVQAIKRGQSSTEAAHLAGFSDSSHLSRTIKSTFGMTSKQLLSSFQSR
jgi:AraC-like DNA-binding protein